MKVIANVNTAHHFFLLLLSVPCVVEQHHDHTIDRGLKFSPDTWILAIEHRPFTDVGLDDWEFAQTETRLVHPPLHLMDLWT